MRSEFMIDRNGKMFCLYAGLLDEAHQQGLKEIKTTLIQIPTNENGNVAICQSQVMTEKGTFTGLGDACPQNVARPMVTCLIRLAETRSKARALRDAVNVGVVALEELGSDDPAAEMDEMANRRGGPAFARPPARVIGISASPEVFNGGQSRQAAALNSRPAAVAPIGVAPRQIPAIRPAAQPQARPIPQPAPGPEGAAASRPGPALSPGAPPSPARPAQQANGAAQRVSPARPEPPRTEPPAGGPRVNGHAGSGQAGTGPVVQTASGSVGNAPVANGDAGNRPADNGPVANGHARNGQTGDGPVANGPSGAPPSAEAVSVQDGTSQEARAPGTPAPRPAPSAGSSPGGENALSVSSDAMTAAQRRMLEVLAGQVGETLALDGLSRRDASQLITDLKARLSHPKAA